MEEPNLATPEGQRRAMLARIAMILTAFMTVLNIVGASVFWISLPEKMKNTSERLEDHETRLRAQELGTSTMKESLARIDERTKGMADGVSQIQRRLDKQ